MLLLGSKFVSALIPRKGVLKKVPLKGALKKVSFSGIGRLLQRGVFPRFLLSRSMIRETSPSVKPD